MAYINLAGRDTTTDREYVVGIGNVNFTHSHIISAPDKRVAKSTFLDLYAPPGTRYGQVRAFLWVAQAEGE